MNKLQIPCSYQGGKQRLSKLIVDIFYKENNITDNTKFYDLCCGSGAITLELLNRGVNPNNIVMIDNGCFGSFWQTIANDEFELNVFKRELEKIPSVLSDVQGFLKNLSDISVDEENFIYHYLILQSGAFGSKQIWIENGKWKNNTFRNYWLPTKTSSRKSPVNPMMPMPNTLYLRVNEIVQQLSGIIVASKEDIFDALYRLDTEWKNGNKDVIVYCDPPYMNTTGYKESFDIYELERRIPNNTPIYISEGFKMEGTTNTYLLSSGRTKGNISGGVKKKPVEEWLNVFNQKSNEASPSFGE